MDQNIVSFVLSLSASFVIALGSASAPKVAIRVENVGVQVNDGQHNRVRSQAVVIASLDHEREVSDHIL